jgi:conjugal transfer/entry exclusion protein
MEKKDTMEGTTQYIMVDLDQYTSLKNQLANLQDTYLYLLRRVENFNKDLMAILEQAENLSEDFGLVVSRTKFSNPVYNVVQELKDKVIGLQVAIRNLIGKD